MKIEVDGREVGPMPTLPEPTGDAGEASLTISRLGFSVEEMASGVRALGRAGTAAAIPEWALPRPLTLTEQLAQAFRAADLAIAEELRRHHIAAMAVFGEAMFVFPKRFGKRAASSTSGGPITLEDLERAVGKLKNEKGVGQSWPDGPQRRTNR